MLSLLAPTIEKYSAPSSTGIPIWVFGVAGGVVLLGLVFLIISAMRGGGAAEAPCKNCGKMMMPEWSQCMFCKTPRSAGGMGMLDVVSGPLAGQSIKLEIEMTTIGSAPNSTMVLSSDSGVSRRHAGIRKGAGFYELADFGSTNGVYVNGEKVAKKRLELGDVIRVGTNEMVFKS